MQLSRWKAGVVLFAIVCVAGGGLARHWRRGAPAREARRIISTLRARPSSPLRWELGGELRAQDRLALGLPVSTAPHAARVTLPARSTEPLRVEDVTTGMAIGVQVRGAFNVVGEGADGYLVYPHAHSSGGTLLHRVVEDGAEDFVSFETRPAVPEVTYDLTLDKEVSGLRLVEGTLEMLDVDGAPRLRAAPPFIVGADGVRTDATLVVEGCAVDTDPAAPWGRDVTPPGGESCTLRVRWPDEQVQYPAVLDPRWQTTGTMTTPRQGHTATLLSTGNVLVVGGTSNGTTALASAELYNKSTGTWAAAASMTGARTLHTSTQLNTGSNSATSGMVLVAGGLNGSTSQNTAQLYSPSAGIWTAAANLNAARHGQVAVLLASGNVLLAGGLNGTTVLNTAAVYNPSSGTGTWTATGNMPQAVKAHTATLLAATSNTTLKNKVIVVGGNSGTASVGNVQLFDGTSTWSSLTALSSTREGHAATALVNGNVLITGGKSGSTILNTTQLFNAASGSGSWASAGTMVAARQLHTSTLLPAGIVANGQVLLIGGNNSTGTLGSAELWNGTSTWTATTALSAAVQGQTATLLSNNMVLVAGGANGSTTVATAGLYDASFALACTSNSQCSTGFCVSGVCCDTACNGGCGVCNLAGKVGTCSAASGSTVCRAQNGACDVAETCNGTSLTCPTDAVAVLGTVCRSATGVCDVPETCDGTTKACPADGFAPATTVCRASTGTCDAAETCTGTSATCPADAFAPATTICRPTAGGCDVAETCTGSSSICPPDGLAAAGTVCRAAESLCDVAETCSGSTAACPTDTFAAAGTTCGAVSNGGTAPVCSGSAGTCPVASGTSDVLGFESQADWALDQSDSGVTTIVGINSNRTQGASSLEVTAQNFARFNSAPMSSIGSIGPLVLLDVLLPTSQANQFWFGDAQMFVSAPSLGINNVPLGDVGMTGLALGTWQTLAFQMPATTAASLAQGVYSDLTFSVVLNVPYNETGHYLLDNIRSIPDVVPSLLGIAQDGATLKAVFDYQTTSSTPVNIPYGTANGLTNQNGFIATPSEVPPTTFVPTTHAPFVATLSGSFLTWTVGSHAVTANPQSAQLPVTTLGDGTHDATLPDGRKINLDSVPPASPSPAQGPPVGAPFNGVLGGQFAVSPSGAATYTVPISIPPGIAGMAPNLGLAYNSQGGDGIAGQGWGLTGLSMITRCPRTRQQDGYGRPVMLDSLTDPQSNAVDHLTDGICLDGEKLFDQLPGQGNCTGSSSVSMCYTPEKQDFSAITLNATGEFQVVTKAGETRYYGLQPADRVNASNGQTAVWMLDHVVDAWGNYFDLHYNGGQTNFTDTGIWISTIDYTGSLGGASQGPPIAPFNTITFGYECRPDIRWSRYASLRIPQNQRLKSITTPQGTYSLAYTQPAPQVAPSACASAQPSLGLSELTSIGYCAGTTCMQPLAFTWQGGQGGTWTRSSNYALPSTIVGTGKGLKGTQFVDIDGDGRLDFVLARTNRVGESNNPQVVTLLNTGSGWGHPLTGPNQTFPLYLSDGNDNPTNVRFVDLDGDGKLDVIVDSANVVLTESGYVSCPVNLPCSGSPTHYIPAVWLNRFTVGGGGGWEFHPEYANIPADDPNNALEANGGINFSPSQPEPAMVADMDGDGKADLVKVGESIMGQTDVDILYNSGPGLSVTWVSQHRLVATAAAPPDINGTGIHFQLRDVNRDGLPDLDDANYWALPDGSAYSQEAVAINQGGAFSVTFTQSIAHPSPTGGTEIGGLGVPPQFGDIDGDGFYDLFAYYSSFDGSLVTDPKASLAAVGFGDGTGFGFVDATASYVNVLRMFSPQVSLVTNLADAQAKNPPPKTVNPIENTDDEDFGAVLADINGDGLADLIRNHENVGPSATTPNQGGIEILYNTGTTWLDPDKITSWQAAIGPSGIPAVAPSQVSDVADIGSAFVDLNGDGFVDLIQEEAGDQGFAAGAWINPNQAPVISTFPNGLAAPTTPTYVNITSQAGAATYKDDDTTNDHTKFLTVPLLVVASTTGGDGSGTGNLNTQTFTYHSLRQDPSGRGPQGFDRIEIQDQASDTLSVTRYAQVYPYTGLPAHVYKYQLFDEDPSQRYLVSETVTTYCDGTVPHVEFECGEDMRDGPPSGPLFVYPGSIVDTAYLHPETNDTADKIVTDSEFQYDSGGNTIQTTVTTTKTEGSAVEAFSKTIVNTYTAAAEQQQGRPDSTVVTGMGGTVPTKHTTTFEYAIADTVGGSSPSQLVLTKKHLEPGAGWPVQLDSAYAYDRFGDLTTTTSCANDFGSCEPNATAPTQSDPLHHPPFRTTSTSYDPSVLGVPVNYGPGRYPTMTTDATGHFQTAVYDPILGAVVTKTDPNGIQTCYTYDALGRPTSEIDRCGSNDPLATTIARYVAPPQNVQCSASAENCTAKVITVTTPPSGNTTWTFTDDQGHTVETLVGAFDGSLIETQMLHDAMGRVFQQSKPFPSSGQPSFTVTVFDSFNRVSAVTDPLGIIDSSNSFKTTTLTTTYDGSTIQTDRTVNGKTQTQKETKNAVGKPATESTLTETGFGGTTYAYDADGNVTVTADPAGNQILVGYDTRGRKNAMTDPDMGSWSYTQDGFGDLVQQIDPNARQLDPSTQGTTMTYDPLGRMLTKSDPTTGTAQWVYDVAPGAGVGQLAAMVSAPDTKLAGPCAIPFVTATDGNRAGKSFIYDKFGEVQQVTECADGKNFVSSYEYDPLGRQSLIRYPVVNGSQLAVGYHYTGLGYLQYLTDESSDYSVLWQAKAMNALGQVTDEQMRNGVETVSTRNPLTGWLLGSTATAHADRDNLIQNWGYGFDEIGNLLTRNRADAVNALTSQETFGYDLTNRLTSAQVATSDGKISTNSYAFDSLGNLTQKDTNSYAYGSSAGCAAGPHAVCTVGGGTLFTYDANGNMTATGSRTVTYNTSNKVREIVSDPVPSQGNDTGTVDFMYGADVNRVVQSATSGGTTTRTVYVGLGGTGKSLYEQITTGTTIQHVNYIYAGGVHGGNAFTLRVLADDGSVTATKYSSFDHLGSVTAMSDEEGRVSNSGPDATLLAYDAWGARRNPDETAAMSASFDLPIGGREFTGQEQIPDVGLVNMNGRVYDPALGRFLSPDPNVQDVSDLQSYNRYSYTLNNPLRYTDPTGYVSWSGFWGSVKGDVENPMFWVQFGYSAFACVAGGPAGCFVAGIQLALFNAAVAIGNGVSFEDTAISTYIGLGVGVASFGALGGINPLLGLAIGSASAAATTAVANRIGTGKWNGDSILASAFLSAAEGAAIIGIGQAANAISKASAAQGGGGSGESVAEVTAREQAAGRAANEAQWTQGYGAPTPTLDSAGNPISVATDYSAKQTNQFLSSAVAELNGKSYISALMDAYENLQNGGWDFKVMHFGDTFMVGNMRLDAGEFGNYFAGYVTTARFGLLGLDVSEAVGQFDNMSEYFWGRAAGYPTEPTVFDPIHDQELIINGSMDATRDYTQASR